MALLSLDTNGVILPIDNEIDSQLLNERQSINLSSSSSWSSASSSSSSTTPAITNKRSLESSTSEQILIKRRYQKAIPGKSIE
jgi:hypothetical protein